MVQIIRARRGPVTLVGIKIEPEEPFVVVGGTQQLTVRARPKSANKGAITWSGGGTAITLSSDGLITGVTAESRLYIQAASDAGFTDWVYARCGYDVTDVSFPDDELTIEGIQGVPFAFSVTPSNATDISFVFDSTDSAIADYYWNAASAQRRMWGYSVGKATVTAKGRSGNAQYPCNVTVTPVTTTGIEFRIWYDWDEVTEQGDSIPALGNQINAIPNQTGIFNVFFTPFNASERGIIIDNPDTDIAEIELLDEYIYDRAYGTSRARRFRVTTKAAGVANITFRTIHGDEATLKVNVVSSMTATASSKTAKIDGSISVSLPYDLGTMMGVGLNYTASSTVKDNIIVNTGRSARSLMVYGQMQVASGTASISNIYAYLTTTNGQTRISSPVTLTLTSS